MSKQIPENTKSLVPENFMMVLMEAMGKNQKSMSNQQIIDSKTTEMNVNIETSIYDYWNNTALPTALSDINWAIEHDKNNDVTYYQQYYNELSSRGQAAEGQQDSLVQSAQAQTSTDASNLQGMVQYAQGVLSILSTLTNMLGNITA